jgi:cell division protein FtsL
MKKLVPPNSEKREEPIKQLFHHIYIEPTDEFKEKSFQKALDGIELARNKERRKKAASKLQLVFSFAAAAAVCILLMIFPSFQTNESKEDVQHSDQQNILMSPQQSLNAEKGEEKGDLSRPESIEMTISLEGMEQKELYHLVNIKQLPFTTYIPDRWRAEYIEEKNLIGAKLIAGNEKYGEVDVMFFPKDTSLGDAENYITDELLGNVSYKVLSAEEEEKRNIPDWSIRSFHYQNAQKTRTGEIYLSEHNGQYFYIQREFASEALEGWGSRTTMILQQWEWKDTKKRLWD